MDPAEWRDRVDLYRDCLIAVRACLTRLPAMSNQGYANQFVCDLVAYEPGKPIEETARELGMAPESIVKLASNENPLGPSPLAKAAMRDAIEEAHIYPDGGGWKLRNAIAEKLGVG